jgi:L-ascorbate peroxidase
MPLEHAPSHLRLAFHDAGTYDPTSETGGAHGAIHFLDEVRRAENTGWGQECLALLSEARTRYPDVSWADLVAIGGAAALQKVGGPVVEVGMGRTDAAEPAPAHRLPGGYEGASLLRRVFARFGFGDRELVVLSGAHTLGFAQRQPFTADPLVFSNTYFVELLAGLKRNVFLPSDLALLDDPDLRALVVEYAEDGSRFIRDFAEVYRRMTWLGNPEPPN